MKIMKLGIVCACVVVALVAGYFCYMAWAFPESKCEAAKHLSAKQMEGDCYTCHIKATPRVAQEWYESKHGITLVRCQTCHGMPDGKGAIVFTRSPGVESCARCHSLAIEKMEAKFGRPKNCVSCHPYHQSAMHGAPYQYRTPAGKTDL